MASPSRTTGSRSSSRPTASSSDPADRPPRGRNAAVAAAGPLLWALAAGLAAVAMVVAAVAALWLSDSAVLVAIGVCVALLPLATGAAILRYRLYDLDRIISRTLAYLVLTVLLGVVEQTMQPARASLWLRPPT